MGGLGALLVLISAPLAAVAADKATSPATTPEVGALAQYRLGPDDRVRITTFSEESLTGEFPISSAGKISLPLVGEISAAGMTTSELATAIQNALKQGYLTDPKVAIDVISFRPYFVLGEVNHPGQFPYSSGMTVLNAVATANGFTYRANQHIVFIRHQGDVKDAKVKLTPTTMVLPGDTIRIGERYF